MLKPPKWGRRRQERLSKENHLLVKHFKKSKCRETRRELAAWIGAEIFIAWQSLILTSRSPTSHSLYPIHNQSWFETWAMSRQPLRKAQENMIQDFQSLVIRLEAALQGVEPNFKGVVMACTNRMKMSWIEQSQEGTKRTLKKSNLLDLRFNRKMRCFYWRLRPQKIFSNNLSSRKRGWNKKLRKCKLTSNHKMTT